MPDEPLHPETRAIRAGRSASGASMAPVIWPSTAYHLPSVDDAAAMAGVPRSTEFYARNGTPTVQMFADAVAELEGAEAALAFGSGMGAISSVVMALCSTGSHVVVQESLFSVTSRLFSMVAPRFGIDVTFVNAFDNEALLAAIRPTTQLVYCETPSNPTMQLVDLDVLGSITGPFTVVDSTLASPVVQQPHRHGVDLVVHAATKAIAGHNDALLGVVTGERELVDAVWGYHVVHGAVASPFDAFLGLRGIRSLHARQRQQCETAQAVAEALAAHDRVAAVHYPGLDTHPQRELAKRQMANGGSIVVFELDGGFEAGQSFMDAVRIAQPALSLGGPETLVTHPASMSAGTLAKWEREEMGIADGMIRISIGLEHADDLVADLTGAIPA